MKLEMRAMEPEREPLGAPSATEVMSGGFGGGMSKRSSGMREDDRAVAVDYANDAERERRLL